MVTLGWNGTHRGSEKLVMLFCNLGAVYIDVYSPGNTSRCTFMVGTLQ